MQVSIDVCFSRTCSVAVFDVSSWPSTVLRYLKTMWCCCLSRGKTPYVFQRNLNLVSLSRVQLILLSARRHLRTKSFQHPLLVLARAKIEYKTETFLRWLSHCLRLRLGLLHPRNVHSTVLTRPQMLNTQIKGLSYRIGCSVKDDYSEMHRDISRTHRKTA